jgi:hypothetical protein
MDAELKDYLHEMKTDIMASMDGKLDALETRIMARMDGRLDAVETRLIGAMAEADYKLETKLVGEFWKWGRTSDLRVRQSSELSATLNERMFAAEDRISALERKTSPGAGA